MSKYLALMGIGLLISSVLLRAAVSSSILSKHNLPETSTMLDYALVFFLGAIAYRLLDPIVSIVLNLRGVEFDESDDDDDDAS